MSTLEYVMILNQRMPIRVQLVTQTARRKERAGSPRWPLQDIVLLQSLIVGVRHHFIAPLPPRNAYHIAIPLHAHCEIYAPPPTLPLYAMHHTILVMTMSCKGQDTSRERSIASSK